jgi:prepilin-type N-terminal cleavage/methylation domain-containing protein
MAMPLLYFRKTRHTDGFSMLEVLIAITILSVGLMALAALLSSMNVTTTNSRYLGTEVLLASEKLEALNQLPCSPAACDAQLAAGGSLAANNTVAGVNYFDQVQISSNNGTVADNPNGVTVAPGTTDMVMYQRRWVIEQDLPVVGSRRVTVLVFPLTGADYEHRHLGFQTTMVRP